MLAKLIIYIAYFLKGSVPYQNGKRFFYLLLETPGSSRKEHFDRAMIGLIVFNIIFLLYDVKNDTGLAGDYFEQGVFIVLLLEYILRLWLYSDTHLILIEAHERALYLNIRFSAWSALKKAIAKKIDYITSTPAIIDLLAIFPSFRQAPLLRVFLIFRLFKLFRYSASARLFSGILVSKRFELYSLLLFACLLVFIASVSVYLFEYAEPNSQINNLFDSFYWAIVTLATVGYGDITAHTTGGRLVTIMLILTSIGVLSFFTSILIAAMNEKLPLMQEKRIAAELERYGSFTIICGYGRVGQEIARLLNQDKQKLIIIDRNPAHIALAQKQGFLTVQDDATKNNVLLGAGILNGATTILCITGDDVTNVYVTLSSRQLNASLRIISRANRHDNVSKLYQAGADYVIRPFEIAGMLAAEFLGQPVAFEAISGILQNQTDIVMETLWVAEHSLLDDLPIADLELEQYKITLLGVISDNPIHLKHKNKYLVKQQHFYFNPEPKFILRRNDILLVFGRKYGVDHFRDQVEQNRLFNWKKA